MPNLINVPGIENTTDEFRQKVVQIAANIEVDPNFLMAIMSFESGGSFSPSKRSPVSSAVGLIQFIRDTAKGLGTTVEALAAMTAIRQLDFVELYFMNYKGRLKTVEDAYMAVLYPKGIGRGGDFVIFRRGDRNYKPNQPLDANGNGEITVAEAAAPVRKRLGAPPAVMVPAGVTPVEVLPAEAALLAKGTRGPEVEALQDELVDLGYMTPEQKKTGPGRFGDKTQAALTSFQRDNLLDPNGTLDPATRAAFRQLQNGVKFLSEGGVVLPMQRRLVAAGKMTEKELATGPGTFGQKTERALMQFQLDNNIQPSGILNDATYKVLYKTVPVIPADKVHGDNDAIDTVLPDPGADRSRGYAVYNREAGGVDQVGTRAAIGAMLDLAREWAAIHPTVLIQYGDVSRRGGGVFFNAKNPKGKPDHDDHKEGRAVDIRPIAKGGAQVKVTINEAHYDAALTRELVLLIRRKFPNSVILFNDPALIADGLTRFRKMHDNHLHWLIK